MKKFILLSTLCLATLALSGCFEKHNEVVGSLDNAAVLARIQEKGTFDLVARNAAGETKWTELNIHNALANEGESSILDSYFRATNVPTSFYLRLYNSSATPGITSTLSTLSTYELATANGYDPTNANFALAKNSTDWPTLTTSASHYYIQSRTVTLTATGAINNINYAAISTTSNNTGKLIAYAQLGAVRSLVSTDQLQITYKVALQ